MGFFGGTDVVVKDEPQWIDPLGGDKNRRTDQATGGPEKRKQIFDSIDAYAPQMGMDINAYASALRGGANDAGWGMAANNARSNMAGQWLGGGGDFNSALFNYRRSNNSLNPTYSNTLSGGFLNQGIPQGPADQFRSTQPGVNSALQALRSQTGQAPTQVTRNTLSGSYLNSFPKIDANAISGAIRQRAGAEASDQNANLQSAFSRAGLGFGTGNQQAQQASRAAATARANELDAQTRFGADQANQQAYQMERSLQANAALSEDAAQRALGMFGADARINSGMFDQSVNASRDSQMRGLHAQNYMNERTFQQQAALDDQGARRNANEFEARNRLQNYQAERVNQNLGAQQLAAAFNPSLQYLSSLPSAYLDPLSQTANIVKGLAGGGTVATPRSQVAYEPGYWDHAMSLVGAVAGVAG